jgi:hypothetical protein
MPKPVKKEPTRALAHYDVEICTGSNAITADRAKEMIGWTPEGEKEKYGDDYLLIDDVGKKIRCSNNSHNRPFTEPWAQTLKFDILKRFWHFNGESIIFSGTRKAVKEVLSGQHRLIGLILADQAWHSERQQDHWKDFWEQPPVIESLVVYGVDSSPATLRTLDNVRPRSISDVLFTEPVFEKARPADRKPLCRMVEHAIKFIWERTGAKDRPFGAKGISQSEAIEFLNHHSRLLKAVKHVYEEGEALRPYVSLGTASGLLYLMAAVNTDTDDYRNAEPPSEKKIDFSTWDRAEEFWVVLGSSTKEFIHVRSKLKFPRVPSDAKETDIDDEEDSKVTRAEVSAVLAKAWIQFKDHHKITPEDLDLEYAENDDGARILVDPVGFSGIDLGDPRIQDYLDRKEREAAKEKKAQEEIESGETAKKLLPGEVKTDEQYAAERKASKEEQKAKLLKNRADRKPRPTDGLTEEGKEAQKKELESKEAANGTKDGPPPKAPPVPKKLRASTRKEIEAENTRKAAEADKLLEQEKQERAKASPPAPPLVKSDGASPVMAEPGSPDGKPPSPALKKSPPVPKKPGTHSPGTKSLGKLLP